MQDLLPQLFESSGLDKSDLFKRIVYEFLNDIWDKEHYTKQVTITWKMWDKILKQLGGYNFGRISEAIREKVIHPLINLEYADKFKMIPTRNGVVLELSKLKKATH